MTNSLPLTSAAPAVQVIRMATAYQASQALFTATSLGIFDLVASGKSNSTDISTALNADGGMTLCLLRALAAYGVLRDEGGGRFQLREVGRILCKDTPNSVRNVVLMYCGDQFALPFSKLPQCILTGKN